jgi:hypothetical protein
LLLAAFKSDYFFSKFVSNTLKLYFPGCAARYQSAIDWWEKEGFKAEFGLFFNFCPNIPPKHGRVQTTPHADRKNIAGGVCAVMAYSNNSKFVYYFVCLTLMLHNEREIQLQQKSLVGYMGAGSNP